MSSVQTSQNDRYRVTDTITIVQRGKRDTWVADFKWEGQHRRLSLKTRNRRAAEERARELDGKLHEGQLSPSLKPLRIRAAIDAFITAKKTDAHTPLTSQKYKTELTKFAEYAESKGVEAMQQITLALYDGYKAKRKNEDELDLYTIYNNAVIAKTWIKWCRRRRLIAIDPLEGLEMSKPRRRRHPAPTLEQVNAILAKAQGQLLAVLAMAAFSGLRIGEIAALRPEDVDLEGGQLQVRRRVDWAPKSEAAERNVPVANRLLTILRAYSGTLVNSHKRTWFFARPQPAQNSGGDRPIESPAVNSAFKALAKACGYTVGRDNVGFTLHALRRFFKTACLDAGVPWPLVDRWLGHRGSEINVHYYRPQESLKWTEALPFGSAGDDEIERAKKGAFNA